MKIIGKISQFKLKVTKIFNSIKFNNLILIIFSPFKWFKKTNRKNRLITIVGILLILTPIVVNSFLSQPKEIAAWWSESWKYRKKNVITNSSSAQTDFQVLITLDTSLPIGEGKMQSDCDDIRFTEDDGSPINFWIESSCNTNATKIWVKISSIPTNGKTIYFYYGNSSANSGSNGDNTFAFFDDFPGSSVDGSKWTGNTANFTVSNGQLHGSDTSYRLQSASSFTGNYIQETRHYVTSEAANGHQPAGFYSSTSNSLGVLYHPTNIWYYRNGGSWIGPSSFNSDQWSRIKITAAGNPSTIYLTGESSGSSNYTGISNDGLSSEYVTLGERYDNSNTGQIYSADWDWIFVRKYASTEPSIGLTGSEEISPGKPIAYWKFDEGYNSTETIPLSANEQQINIIDQVYTFNGVDTNYKPTDNSLGLIHWDGSKFSNKTVYFEADFRGCGAVETITATLYTSSGTALSSSSISQTGSTFARIRSNAITLTDGTDYTVRVKGNRVNSGDTYVINAARLIIVQSSNSITNTETQIEIGASEFLSANTATELTNKKIYQYDSSKFNPTPTAYFEASIKSSPPTIEQQINIIDQTYTTTLNSYVPTDNSLGLIRWSGTRYSDATVYFEVVMAGSGSAETAYASLYAGDTAVNGSEISKQGGGYALVRSSAITLNDGTNYTVRFKGNRSGDTYTLRAARIIVQQNNPTKITNTQTSIEIGDNTTTSNTSYTPLTNPKYYQYNKDLFNPTVESSGDATFSASLKVADGADTAYAALYNKTHGNMVAEVSTSNTTWTYRDVSNIDSDADWDTTNDDEYEVQIRCVDGNGGGCTTSLANAKIILDQYSDSGITDFETLQEQMNTNQSITGTSPTIQNYHDSYNYGLSTVQNSFAGGIFTYYYESTLKTSTAVTTTAYAGLYNVTNASTITNSLVSSTAITYSRQRSGDITANLPQFPQPSVKTMDTTLYNSTAGQTTTASTSWLIIKVSGLATSTVTAYADLYNLTDSVQVSNSEVSTSSASWGLRRSGSITIHSGDSYSVRLRSSNNGINIYLANAKIILDQGNSDGITAVETVYQMVNTAMTDSDNGYSYQYFYNSFDPSNFTYQRNVTLSDYFFESTIKTSAGTGYAILNSGSDITASEISTTSATYNRIRSGSLSLVMPTSTTNMDTRIKNGASDTTSVSNSWIIVQNNDTIANVIHDNSGYLHHGNANNSPTWKDSSDCKFDKCLSFDGTNDFVAVGDSYDFDFAASDSFTISAWFKHPQSSSGQDTILAKYYSSTGTDGGYKLLMEADGDITFAIDDDSTWTPDYSTTSTAATYDDNIWHHVEAVKDGSSNLKLYIDGILVGTSGTISGTSTLANTDSLYIGIDGDGSSNPWAGMLDEIKIYPYVRSSNQIKVDYTGAGQVLGAGTEYTLTNGLIGYWKMDESSWGTPNCTNGVVLDSSGNGNNGLACPATTGPAGGVTGKYANGGYFGGNDFLKVTTDNYQSQIETMSVWFNTGAASGKLLYYSNTSAWYGWQLYINASSNVQFELLASNGASIASVTSSSNVSDNIWHNAVVTYDNSKLSLYIDGKLENTSPSATTQWTSGMRLYWGAARPEHASPYGWYTGYIDEVRLYNRVITPGEVENLYNWAPGPVGYWKMDENTGTNAFDSSGYGSTGTLSSGPTWTTGKFGSSVDFSGSNKVVDCGDSTSLRNLKAFTVEAWINPRSLGESNIGAIINKEGGGDNLGWALTLSFSGGVKNIKFLIGRETENLIIVGSNAEDSVNLNTWQHVAVVYDDSLIATNVKIYINGILKPHGSDQTGSGTRESDSGWSLGIGNVVNGTGQDFDGLIDEAKIYNYARTPAQIIEDMNADHPAPGGPIGSAVGEWKFDEGYGDTTYNLGSGGSTLNGNLAGSGTSCPQSGDSACPTWTNEGKYGKALRFDTAGTTDDYVDFGSASSLDDLLINDAAISLWFKADGTWPAWTFNGLFQKSDNPTPTVGYNLRLNVSDPSSTQNLLFRVENQNQRTINLNKNVNDGQWHQLLLNNKKDGTTCTSYFYIDTNLQGNMSFNCAYNSDASNNFILGRSYLDGLTYFFDGYIDDLKIYNSSLTDDQIKLLYNQGQAAVFGSMSTASSSATMTSSARSYCPPGDTGACNPPVGEWKMDEGTGITVNDTSGNNINGTLTQNGTSALPTWVNGKRGNGIKTVNNGSGYGNSGSINFGTNKINPVIDGASAVTVEGWIYPTYLWGIGGQDNIFFESFINNWDAGIWGRYRGDYNDFYVSAMSQSSDSSQYCEYDSVMSTNNWVYISMVVDFANDQIKIYYNGTLKQQCSATFGSNYYVQGSPNSYANDGIGANIPNALSDSIFDNYSIYDYARTPAQIAWDYNQGAPLVWYKFDECSGTTAFNLAPAASGSAPGMNGNINAGTSGNLTTGSCNSGVNTEMWNDGTSGKYNGSLGFDGSDDYVSLPANLTIAKNVSSFTISAWIYPNSLTGLPQIVSIGTNATGAFSRFFLAIEGGVISAGARAPDSDSADTVTTVNPPTQSQWQHITAVYNIAADSISIYVNGVKKPTTGSVNFTNTVTDNTDSSNSAIGSEDDGSSFFFNGQIDDVKIWNYALTPEQVKTEYNQGSAVRFGP